jgi:hypothetical protein
MKQKAVLIVLALFACGVLMAPSQARADTDLGLQLSSNGVTQTTCDQDMDFTGCTHNSGDANPVAGVVTFVGSVDKWTINVATGTGSPVFSLPDLMDLNDISVTGGNGNKALTLILTQTFLTAPLTNADVLNTLGGTSSIGGTTVSVQSWFSASNKAFCTDTTCGAKVTDQSFSGKAFSGMTSGIASATGPYSITMVITIDSQGNADTTSFDSMLQIPEPATLSVLGAGLLAFGTGLRRKLARG